MHVLALVLVSLLWRRCDELHRVPSQEAEPPPPPSEFDALDIATLKRTLLELRVDTEKTSRERALAQVDRVRAAVRRVRGRRAAPPLRTCCSTRIVWTGLAAAG